MKMEWLSICIDKREESFVEQIQFIAEKEMTSKLIKQFSIRTIIYSFIYLGVIAILFIVSLAISKSSMSGVGLSLLLITAINVLFLLMLSKSATTEAFDGVNTTSAPEKSLKRILSAISVPLFIITAIFTFLDVLLLHSLFDISNGYTNFAIGTFIIMFLVNVIVFLLVLNIYEKKILQKYLIITE